MQKILIALLCLLPLGLLAQQNQRFHFNLSSEKAASPAIDLTVWAQSLTEAAPFYTLAVVWEQTGETLPSTEFRWRAGSAADWQPWQSLRVDAHGQRQDGSPASQLIILPAATAEVQLRRAPSAGQRPLQLQVDLYAPTGRYPLRPSTPVTRSDSSGCARPAYQTRSEWGCPDGPIAPEWWPGYFPVTHLVVHHTATGVATPYEALVNSIWQYHTNTLGWGDIGYNWLIAPDGTLYEGRAGGDHVAGGHMCARNGYTMGVGLLGDFTNAQPTDSALATLRQLLAYHSCAFRLNPLDSAVHVRSGYFLPRIIGHRDGCNPGYTECPGAQFYPTLPQLRDSVAADLARGGYRASLSDFVVTRRSLSTDELALGQSLLVDYEATIVGLDTPFISIRTGVYLSTDQVFDASDSLLSTKQASFGIGWPVASLSDTIVLPSWVTVGNYYVLFVVDDEQAVNELDERNNLVFRPLTVTEATTGLSLGSENPFRVHPNPFVAELHVQWPGEPDGVATWRLTDQLGRAKVGGLLQLRAGQARVSLPEELATGIWYFSVEKDGKQQVEVLRRE